MSARGVRREPRPWVTGVLMGLAVMLGSQLLSSQLLGLRVPLAGAQTASGFPAPLLAPVDSTQSENPAAITAFYRDPESAVAEPLFLVALRTPVSELPEGTRISLLTGDPAGARQRSSLYLDAAGPRGETEQGDASGFTTVQPGEVAITPDGLARIRLATIPDSDLVWAETEMPDGQISTSGIFPLGQVTGASGPGALTPADMATVVDGDRVPTGEFVPMQAVPTLEVVNQDITVRTTQAVPTDVNGVPVTSVRDILRIAPDVATSGKAPYFVLIEYTPPSVTFLDATGELAVEVDADRETWLVDDLEADEDALASVTLDRAGLLTAVGLDPDAPAALGVSRIVQLEDGRYLQAEGPVATLQWFDESGAGPIPSTSAEVTTTVPLPTAVPDDAALEEDGADATVVIVAAVIAAVLAGIALFAARQNRRAYGDPDAALGAMAKVVDKTAHEKDDDGEIDAERSTARSGRSGVRAPSSAPVEPATVADAVGVAGARAVVTRQAQAFAAERAHEDDEAPGLDRAETDPTQGDDAGRDALWAAMRRKAAEAEAASDEAAAGPADGDEPDHPSPTGEPVEPTMPGAGKTTRPDDALDALNRVIDDLQLPGDR